MADPTLSEISNINTDPALSGVAPEPVIDNSHVVDQLNQTAKFHAQNQFNKYNQFLQNKKELFQNISDIQGLETLPEDKDALHKQAGDILGEILKNPSVITGGAGYGEIQSKIAKFKSDAMASKASALDEKTNKLFLDRNPDLYTDENVKAMEEAKKTPLGQRKSVMLQMPTILDEKTLFDNVLKNSTHPYDQVVGKDGKAGQGYIETGLEANPKAIAEQWKLALEGQKDKYGHSILSAVKLNFGKLPEEEQQRYKDMGGNPVENYFNERGQKYLDAYLPKGSYEPTPEGNYRFGKTLKSDPNYLESEKLGLEAQKLREKTSNDNAEREIGWAHIGIDRDKLKQTKKEDQDGAATVINEATSIINNGTLIDVVDERTGKKHSEIRISDPTLLQTFGTIDKSGKVTHVPDAMRFNPKTNQVTLLYKDQDSENQTGGLNTRKEESLDQRTWLKTITKRSFPNKDIGGVNSLIEDVLKANNESLFQLTKKESTPTQQPQNDTKYYSDQSNLVSQKGNKFTFKDGTEWEYKNGKLKKIK